MYKNLNIAIACDHAGFDVKQEILIYLQNKNISYKDFGTYSKESTDYPDFVHPLAQSIENKEFTTGIVLCGSGNGVNMTVNKYQGIRSALCWNPEIASLARKHNDANVCALPARFINFEEAIKIVEIFLNTEFDGGRHTQRIEKIPLK
jgi:ribose 5-phosphate isomerase B